MSKVMILSADGHAAPAMVAYRPYVESRYHGAFDELVASSVQVTTNFADNVDPKIWEPYKAAFYDSGAIEGKWDVDRRIKELNGQGIQAEVLFPDGAPFGAGGIGANRAKYRGELELAGARAYNRWVADFIAPHAERFAAQAIISLWDVDEAIKDVYWAKEHGLKGLVMPGLEGTDRKLWDPVFESFWSACEETGLPLNYHGGVASQPDYGPQIEGVPFAVRLRIQSTEYPWYTHRPLWWLIWTGTLERHPGLKLVFTEQHSEWVPEVLAKLDHSYDHTMYDDAIKSVVPRRPSEYWARQCYTGSSLLSRNDLRRRHQIGHKNMMFGADFPHPEGTSMRTLKYLQATVGHNRLTPDEARDFLGATAAQVFGFDTDALLPLVDEHGLDLEDVLTPLPEEFEHEFQRTDVVRP